MLTERQVLMNYLIFGTVHSSKVDHFDNVGGALAIEYKLVNNMSHLICLKKVDSFDECWFKYMISSNADANTKFKNHDGYLHDLMVDRPGYSWVGLKCCLDN